MTPQHLKNLADQREQLSILVAFVPEKMASLTDRMLHMNNNLVTEMFQKSKRQQDRKLQRDGKQVNRILGLHQKIGAVVIGARAEGKYLSMQPIPDLRLYTRKQTKGTVADIPHLAEKRKIY